MRHFTVPAILFLFLSLQGFTQWNWIYPLPQGNDLNKLFINNSTGLGFAVGRHGALLKTENLGFTWELKDSVTTSELFSGCFAGDKAFIVGDNGVILKTSDFTNWDSVESGSHYRLNTIVFADPANGYIGGYKGFMMKTTDAGESWQEMNSVTLQSIYSGFFFTPDLGIFVGDSGLILKTTDAGFSWSQSSSGTNLGLLDIAFPSASVGYIAGKKGLILKTTDGGNTWTDVSFDPMDDEIYSVFFWNDTLGYVAGAYGKILRTINGGESWEFYQSGTDLAIRSVVQFHHGEALCDSLIVCGDYGLISRTDSCGFWSNVTNASSYTFNSIAFTSDRKGIAVGGDPFTDKPFILRTDNPEAAWQPLIVDTITHYLTDVCFSNDTTGYISGREGSIYKTSDGGVSWIPLDTDINENLYSLCFPEPEMGFACGEDGTIIKTISGDTTWTALNSGTTEHLFSLYFIDATNGGYAVGDAGKILRIRNNGSLISGVPSGTSVPLYDIFFPTDSVGFVVGYAGKILKIKRGAISDSLFPVSAGILTPLNKVFFPCPDTGYIAGEGGVMLKSTDRGETWYPVYTETSNSLRGLYFINDTVGFAVGAGVTVIKTESGGGAIILPGIIENSEDPISVNLYPNPASEFITLEIQAEKLSQVNISIFDIAGRKIKDLSYINNPVSGTQSFSFSIADFKTGIYLMIVQTGNKFQSKKLVVF